MESMHRERVARMEVAVAQLATKLADYLEKTQRSRNSAGRVHCSLSSLMNKGSCPRKRTGPVASQTTGGKAAFSAPSCPKIPSLLSLNVSPSQAFLSTPNPPCPHIPPLLSLNVKPTPNLLPSFRPSYPRLCRRRFVPGSGRFDYYHAPGSARVSSSQHPTLGTSSQPMPNPSPYNQTTRKSTSSAQCIATMSSCSVTKRETEQQPLAVIKMSVRQADSVTSAISSIQKRKTALVRHFPLPSWDAIRRFSGRTRWKGGLNFRQTNSYSNSHTADTSSQIRN